MATAFENFALTDLVANPEDVLRLASLAVVEGRKVRGYSGEYFQYRLGDATVSVRTTPNYKNGDLELYGMDTHALSDCVWDCVIEHDITPDYCDPMERCLLVSGKGKGLAAVNLVNADVLPVFFPGTPLRLNMVAFPKWIDYLPDEAAYVEAQKSRPDGQNAVLEEGGLLSVGYAMTHDPNSPAADLKADHVLIRGVVKDMKVGETYMGMEPMTTFIRATVATDFGDIEICHTAEMVAEDQKEIAKVGATVSALCVLSGDAAIGLYAGGICCNLEQDLLLLKNFFENGGADRLRPAMHSECTYVSDVSGVRLEGVDAVIALLKDVEEAVDDKSRYYAYPAHLTGIEVPEGETAPAYIPGQKFLLLAQGAPEQYVALCFVETDSVGRIKNLRLSQDGRYTFELDNAPEAAADAAPARDAREAMLACAVAEGVVAGEDDVPADAAYPAFEEVAQEKLQGLLATDADLEKELPILFGELFAGQSGQGWETGRKLYAAFHRYVDTAKLKPGAYRQQLMSALVLVQRLGELNQK